MFRFVIFCSLFWCLTACGVGNLFTDETAQPLPPGSTIVVNDLRDEALDDAAGEPAIGLGSFVDNDCSIREMINAARSDQPARPRDACVAGTADTNRDIGQLPAGVATLAGSALDDVNASGDLDIGWYNIEIDGAPGCSCTSQGVCAGCTEIDAAGHDRGIHAAQAGTQKDVRLRDLVVRNGIADGGASNQFGGGIYMNVGGYAEITNIWLFNNRGLGGGGALRTCADANTPTNYVMRDIHVFTSRGAGVIQTHVAGTWTNVEVHTSTTTGWQTGAFDIFDKTTTCVDCEISDNWSTAPAPLNTGFSVRGPQAGMRGELLMVRGHVTPRAGSIGLSVGAACATVFDAAQNVTYGCRAVLSDAVINGVVTQSGTGRVELYGTTTIASCTGTVYLYGAAATVTNPAGCTIVHVGPVCGNGSLEAGEACDDGNTAAGDCCSATCAFETGACNDGDACTVGDTCDGAGTCLGGSESTCGDGVVNCSEECDLGAANGMMSGPAPCRLDCTLATCAVWE